MQHNKPLSEHFIITDKIGSGSFGEIYNGSCAVTGEALAIKQERSRNKKNYLEHEFQVLSTLQGGIGIPRVFEYLTENSEQFMSMELLGSNLESLLQICKGKFSLKTVLMIADQCISRIEFVHSRLFIHRDIKPENFVVGVKRKAHVLYLIDFGLAKRFMDPVSLKHIKFEENKKLTGTARFASCFTHQGFEQSRRDDLESLAYMLIYFLHGTLPWIGLVSRSKAEKYKQIAHVKANCTPEDLVRPGPIEFLHFLEYCRALKFEEKPDYAYLKKIFKDLFCKMRFCYDYIFQWELKKPSRTHCSNKQLMLGRRISPMGMLQEASQIKDSSIGLSSNFNSFIAISCLPVIDIRRKQL